MAHVPDKETGVVMVNYDQQGQPQYDIVRDVAWDYIDFEKASPEMKSDIEQIKAQCCAVCWGTLGQREPVSRQFIQSFIKSITAPDALKVYDPNLRSEVDAATKEIIHQSLQLANTVKLSHDEVDKIGEAFEYFSPINKPNENKGEQKDYDERSRILFEKYPNINTLIITLSDKGSYIYTRNGEFSPIEIKEKVENAKPVGCGDSFLAGVIASLVSGKDLVYAHEKGTAVSRFVAQNDSATPELPDELVIK